MATETGPSLASGDIRNIVKTVNGLPGNYRGRCTIIVNDIDPQVTARNLIILAILLDTTSKSPAEEVAEAALHISYSAAVTKAQEDLVKTCHGRILSSNELEGRTRSWFSGSPCEMLRYELDEGTMAEAGRLLKSSYSLQEAKNDMHRIMMAPSRVDYRDRYLASLRPHHRVAHMKWRDGTGIVLPFGEPAGSFTEPNR